MLPRGRCGDRGEAPKVVSEQALPVTCHCCSFVESWALRDKCDLSARVSPSRHAQSCPPATPSKVRRLSARGSRASGRVPASSSPLPRVPFTPTTSTRTPLPPFPCTPTTARAYRPSRRSSASGVRCPSYPPCFAPSCPRPSPPSPCPVH